MNKSNYYSLSEYLKDIFHEKVYRLSLNGGMSCPNRDGRLDTRGCIFCSSGGSGDFAASAHLSITDQIEQAKQRISKKTTATKFIAYFQAYTNTYGDISYLRKLYLEAVSHPDIVVLSIATRPDCLSSEVISLLKQMNQIKPVWIELGLQTIHAPTLEWIRSGFTLADFNEAVANLTKANISVVVHLIFGLKAETTDMMLESVDYICQLPIQGVKLQLLHVLKGTDLGDEYERSPFYTFSLEEYALLIKEVISRIPKHIVVHRITGDGPKNLLLAPLWSGNKKLVLNTLSKIIQSP